MAKFTRALVYINSALSTPSRTRTVGFSSFLCQTAAKTKKHVLSIRGTTARLAAEHDDVRNPIFATGQHSPAKLLCQMYMVMKSKSAYRHAGASQESRPCLHSFGLHFR